MVVPFSAKSRRSCRALTAAVIYSLSSRYRLRLPFSRIRSKAVSIDRTSGVSESVSGMMNRWWRDATSERIAARSGVFSIVSRTEAILSSISGMEKETMFCEAMRFSNSWIPLFKRFLPALLSRKFDVGMADQTEIVRAPHRAAISVFPDPKHGVDQLEDRRPFQGIPG